ncbi:serine/threonine-protein kinase DCLK3 [Alosa pseudoharengus]|uniref:serine/threonine-protein kinase DCLK3 n=1 Tax=Alosa pseudoharengus TaxID=34774 RepID=UPI003F890568
MRFDSFAVPGYNGYWRAVSPSGLAPNCPDKGGAHAQTKCVLLTPLAPSVIGGCANKVSGHHGHHTRTGGCAGRRNGFHTRHAEGSPVRPHLVTIIKPNEDGAIRKISLLLNRRAVVSFEQLISDVSEALGYPSWNNDRVRHLFTPAGQAVSSLSQFFQVDNAFLALGRTRPSLTSLQMALEELYPGCQEYCNELVKRWQRSMRPKASKADSGFHDDSEKADSSPSSIQTIKPSANNLQPIRGRREHKERHLDEEHKRDRERKLRRRKEKMEETQGCKRTGNKYTHTESGLLPDVATAQDHRSVPLQSNGPGSTQIMKSQEVLSQEAARQAEQDMPELPDGEEVTQTDIERCYDIGRVVGDGNFAVVRVCVERRTGHTWAVKVVDKAKLQGRDHMIHNEVSLLASLRHPKVVHLLRCHHTNTHVYLIMELASEGDLFDAIVTSVKFSEVCAAGMLKDISDALQFIHSRSIVHRDIKPENLLVHRHDDAVTLKLADFGLALVVTEPLYTICGTPTYVAPEILAETGYGVAVDVWAMGVILYILLCGFPPFRSTERNQVELFKLIRAGDLHFLSPYWDKISEGVKDLIRGLLRVDPKGRLTAQQAMQHSWVRSRGRSHGINHHTQHRPQMTITDTSPPLTTLDYRLPQIHTAHRDYIRSAKTKEAIVHQTSRNKLSEDEDRAVRTREASVDQTNKLDSVCRLGGNKETNKETSGDLKSRGT